MPRPHPRHVVENWRNSPDPPAVKARQLVKNNLLKIRRRSHCCGNYGEPGC